MRLSWLILSSCLALPVAFAQDEAKTTFDAVDEAMRVGNKANAANALIAVIDNEEATQDHAEAYRRLAKVYYEYQLSYSALLSYGKALELDPEGTAGSVGVMLDLAEQVGDSELIGGWLAANPELVLDSKTAAVAALPLARHHLDNGDFGTAMTTIESVPASAVSYPDAQVFSGCHPLCLGQTRPSTRTAGHSASHRQAIPKG